MKDKKPIAILDQFIENTFTVNKGKTITYMTTFYNIRDDGRMPNSIAVFKIYLKEPQKTIMDKLFPFMKKRKIINWAAHHLIANQIHP